MRLMSNNMNMNIGFVGLLTLLFIALKLTYYISWSWWWVLAPIWISVLFYLILFCLGIAFIIIMCLITTFKEKF